MDVDNFISDHLYVKKESWKETTQTATSMKKRRTTEICSSFNIYWKL